MLQVRCQCGQVYQLADEMAGKKARCQSCRTVFQVPGGTTSQNVGQASQPVQQQQPVQQRPAHPQQPVPQNPGHQQPVQQQPGQPFSQIPAQQQAYPYPGYQQGNQKRKAASKNKAWLWGAVGGGAAIVILVLIIIFSRGNNQGETNDSSQQAARQDADRPKRDNNQNQSNGVKQSNTKSGFDSLRFSSSENGLCKLIVYKKLGFDSSVQLSRNGQYGVITELAGGNSKTRIILFDKRNPDRETSHELDGVYTVTAVNNDGRFLALKGKERNEIFDWSQKKSVRVASVVYFSADAKYAILHDKVSETFVAALDLAQDKIVWAVKYPLSRLKELSSDLSYELDTGSKGKIYKVDLATRESSELATAPHDSKIGNQNIYSPGIKYLLVRHGNKLLGYDVLDGGKQFFEMDLPGKTKNIYAQATADRSMMAITLRESASKNGIGIVDLSGQKIIDRIPVDPFGFTLSDDGSTLWTTLSTPEKHLAVWSINHNLPGQVTAASKPYFEDLPVDQRIASSLNSEVEKFNSQSKNTAPVLEQEAYWTNSLVTCIKAIPSKRAFNANEFLLSADGNHVAYGVARSSSKGNLVIWDNRFLPKELLKQAWLMGISSDGNRIGIKHWLTDSPMKNDRIEVWDQLEEKIVFQATGAGYGSPMFFAPDGQSFLLVKNNRVQRIGIGAGANTFPAKNWATSINSVSPDFKQLAEVNDQSVKIFDISQQELIREVQIPSGRAERRNAVSFESNRMLLKAGNAINLIDLTNGRSIGTHLLPTKSYINLTRISADGKNALVSYSLDSVDHYLLLKLSNQGIQPVGELPKPGDAKCYDFAISQDGTELYSYAFWTRKGRGGTNFMLRWKVN